MIQLLDEIKFFVYSYALIITCIEAVKLTKKVIHLRKTRHLRKVWGIKDKEDVILVCSELEQPEKEQFVGIDNEFIYNRKYGDLDAYFEAVYTLLRLYPNLKLRVLSCGEAAQIKLQYDKTLILIGGPDYNSTTEDFLEKSQFDYRSADMEIQSETYPNNIVLFHKSKKKEYCEENSKRDFGYFERIINPHNSKGYVIIIGGCHTIGVTAAMKAFSMMPNEHGEINNHVLLNSRRVAKKISNKSEFAILVNGERSNQTIHTPLVKDEAISILDIVRK